MAENFLLKTSFRLTAKNFKETKTMSFSHALVRVTLVEDFSAKARERETCGIQGVRV